jgi:hypothetical protein
MQNDTSQVAGDRRFSIYPDSHRGTAGYVFGANEGEHLLHFRDGGKICIKVGPAIGSDNFTLGSQ